MRKFHRFAGRLTFVAILVSAGATHAGWDSPTTVGDHLRIVPNPVNGGVASVEAIWDSGEWDLEVKFIDDLSTPRTKTIASIGSCDLFDHKPVCAVDPNTGDVAVAWWEVNGGTYGDCPGDIAESAEVEVFKYKIFDAGGGADGTTTTLQYFDIYDVLVDDASLWDFDSFIDGLPTFTDWSNNDDSQGKFEGWVDITHSGKSGEGWHIAVSYMYCAHSKWDDFYTTFGSAQNYNQSVLFRFATLVYQNVGTVGEEVLEVFASDDDDPSREYFDSPSVMQYKEWARVPAKVTPITVGSDSVSGVLYVPTYGAIYQDDLEWAEDGTTTGSLSLDLLPEKASLATSTASNNERVHIAYDNKIVYKTPGTGSWSSANTITGTGEKISNIVAIPNTLDTLYVMTHSFVADSMPGGCGSYDGDWYYDYYTMSIKKLSSIDGTESLDATYNIAPGDACSHAYWAYDPYLFYPGAIYQLYPGRRSLAIEEDTTPGTPSEIKVIFHQADWDSMNRYDEDWEAIPGQVSLTTYTP